jgi:hypothetical protein
MLTSDVLRGAVSCSELLSCDDCGRYCGPGSRVISDINIRIASLRVGVGRHGTTFFKSTDPVKRGVNNSISELITRDRS